MPWEKTIFYETHVKGFTKLHPAVPERLRGTYAGLGNPAVLDYIKSLGVTSVELLPVHAFVQDDYLQEKDLVNYWGYNTISFFTPARRYAAVPDFAFSEFKEMVARMHGAGLEVILDVVYNHTAEGNEKGPTLSFKGVDNASYYRLLPGQEPRYYINDTGTGNTFNLSHPARAAARDRLACATGRTEMRVDGFRFDLATILGREPHGFDEGGGFLDTCRQDPVLNGVKLIAEPWDCGPGGYQVGGFPPGWAEWNDRFRDDVRGYWRGDEGMLPDLAARLTGSADKFNKRGRKPWASVNFLTAHDGFTLNDTVVVQREAQRWRTARTTATATRTTSRTITASRGRPTIRRSARCACARCATCWRRCSSRAARRCCWPATSSPAPRTATTTPIARTTRSPGSTGRRSARRSGISPSSRSA